MKGMKKVTQQTLALVALGVCGDAAQVVGSHAMGSDAQCVVVSTITTEPVPPVQEGGGLVINATFNANITGVQQAVIQQAINEWQAAITVVGQRANPFPITFLNGPLGNNTLAVANTGWNLPSGMLTGATITIDNDGTSVWWNDPTPGNDSEFDSAGSCQTGQPCAGATDLLTVMRHEIGHALGWTGAFGVTTNPLVVAQIAGTTFDSTRLNIAMDPAQTSHSSGAGGGHPDDVMNPLIPTGRRRPLSLYPAVSLVARAFNDDTAMAFIDGDATGTATGTADQPWTTLIQALAHEVVGTPMLFIPDTYDEIQGALTKLTILGETSFRVARGGDAVIE